MTFTFVPDLTIDRDFVRFETGDTTEGQNFLSDELITSLLATTDTKYLAVLKGLKFIITQLSRPDFKADWLDVKNGEARKGYEKMLSDKADEYGISLRRTITASVVNTYRSDSYMEDPN
jgi:hypothetical protein